VLEEHGFALVMALGVVIVLSIAVTTSIYYTSTNSRSAGVSLHRVDAHSFAEAGLNNASSILNANDASGSANALNSTSLSGNVTCPDGTTSCLSATFDGGTAYWKGTYDANNTIWTVTSWGKVSNPGSADLTSKITATILVFADPTQPQNATAWNYAVAHATSNATTCDMNIVNSVVVDYSLYVDGNLCLNNTSNIQKPASGDAMNLAVGGKLSLQGTGTVGTSGTPISTAKIGTGCNTSVAAAAHACTSADNVYAGSYPAFVAVPFAGSDADFTSWYGAATPGPNHACTTTSGTPPVWDNDTTQNLATNGSAGTFNLTPASSYTCTTATGGLSWNATTHVLTLSGTVYFDGSMTSSNGVINSYTGQGVIYLTGTFAMSGSTGLCALLLSGNCNWNDPTAATNPGWDPNTRMLVISAHGNNGANESITFANSSQFQGGLYTDKNINFANSTQVQGPIEARGTMVLGNSVVLKPLAYITTLPLGAPGNPNTHASTKPPVITG
jgi:Tfp pilus assembly protein PilX